MFCLHWFWWLAGILFCCLDFTFDWLVVLLFACVGVCIMINSSSCWKVVLLIIINLGLVFVFKFGLLCFYVLVFGNCVVVWFVGCVIYFACLFFFVCFYLALFWLAVCLGWLFDWFVCFACVGLHCFDCLWWMWWLDSFYNFIYAFNCILICLLVWVCLLFCLTLLVLVLMMICCFDLFDRF